LDNSLASRSFQEAGSAPKVFSLHSLHSDYFSHCHQPVRPLSPECHQPARSLFKSVTWTLVRCSKVLSPELRTFLNARYCMLHSSTPQLLTIHLSIVPIWRLPVSSSLVLPMNGFTFKSRLVTSVSSHYIVHNIGVRGRRS
jgi:hypothetical protein